jgi:hypothetical protein
VLNKQLIEGEDKRLEGMVISLRRLEYLVEQVSGS